MSYFAKMVKNMQLFISVSGKSRRRSCQNIKSYLKNYTGASL